MDTVVQPPDAQEVGAPTCPHGGDGECDTRVAFEPWATAVRTAHAERFGPLLEPGPADELDIEAIQFGSRHRPEPDPPGAA
jgi:hypothetical protein